MTAMTARRWLRHPARTIGTRPPCPHGQPYATEQHARAALTHGLAPTSLQPQRCTTTPGCGWHNEPEAAA